jgi:uncharacterized membrane protein YozB (DUF420 family)
VRLNLFLLQLVRLLAILLVCHTTLVVVLTLRDYFPPNFRSTFLLGREGHFFGPYRWAFTAHVLSGPFCLLSGLVLLSEGVRRRWPALHRGLGKAHVVAVIALLTPSGLWMAPYAMEGVVPAAGFATLAVATGASAATGWRMAAVRRFREHQRWMQRTFALLVSAVVLRVIGGASEVWGLEGTYPWAAWLSWLVPLMALELLRVPRVRSVFVPVA